MTHSLSIRYADDGGENYSNWKARESGNTGAFLTELKWWQLGSTRHRIWEICDTSNVSADLMAAQLIVNDGDDWADFPLPDGSYSDATRPWSQQDVCNYLPTFAESSGTRSRVKYACVPGLQTFATVGDGPHRGARDVEGKLFVVSGRTLYQVATDGTATSKGTIPGTGLVSMTHNQIANGNQLLIGTGDNSYLYDTVLDTLVATGIPLTSVDFLNQLFLGVDQARRFSRYSGLADGMSWNTLDNLSAESAPDRIVGGIVSQGEWLVFGERTIEPWSNTPSQDTAFVRNSGCIAERGCINANTIKRLDNTVFFVDNNFIPCRMQGSQPVPIAPKSIIDELSLGDPQKLLALTWEDRGYVTYYLTAQDGRTWGYDVTSQKWHRRESFGLDRWRLNTLFKWNGDWYGGDFQSGKLYKLVRNYVYEGCEIMPRRIRSGVLHNNGNRVVVNGVKLTMQTGGTESISPENTPPTITGSLPALLPIGTIVNYQYTVSAAHPGQVVTLTLGGSLPAGLTMSATGLVTGTVSASGVYNWTITPSTDCATGTPLGDGSTSALFDMLITGTGLSVGAPGAATSQTAAAWTGIPASALPVPGEIAYGGGRWFVIKAGAGYYTDNLGATWNVATVPASGSAVACADFGNGVVVAVGASGLIYRSTDNGATYSTVTDTVRNAWCIAYGNGKWVMGVANDVPNTYRYSVDDGLTFSQGSVAIPYTVDCALYANGVWALGGGTSTPANPGSIRVSTDDLATFGGGTGSAPSRVESMAYGNGTWVAVCYGGQIIRSTDNWSTFSTSATTIDNSSASSAIAFNGEKFVIVDNKLFLEAKTYASVDGDVWEAAVSTGLAGDCVIRSSYRA